MATTTKGFFNRGIGGSGEGTFGLFSRGLIAGPSPAPGGGAGFNRTLSIQIGISLAILFLCGVA